MRLHPVFYSELVCVCVEVLVLPPGAPFLISESQLKRHGTTLYAGDGPTTLRGPNGVHYPLSRGSSQALVLYMQLVKEAAGPILLVGAPAGMGKLVIAIFDTGATQIAVPLQDADVLFVNSNTQ